MAFENSQRDRERSSASAERRGEIESMEKERERMKEFYAGQKSRAEEYRSEQEKLTRACFKVEESRIRRLRAWAQELLNRQQE